MTKEEKNVLISNFCAKRKTWGKADAWRLWK